MGTVCRARIEGGISSSQDSTKVGCEIFKVGCEIFGDFLRFDYKLYGRGAQNKPHIGVHPDWCTACNCIYILMLFNSVESDRLGSCVISSTRRIPLYGSISRSRDRGRRT